MPGTWVDRYVGIPFSEDGLDFRACSCWGLVRLVLQQECGLELPTYGDLSADDLLAASRQIGRAAELPPWLSAVGRLQTFDVVVMHARRGEGGRVPGHVGILSSPSHILHVERATAAVCVSLSHPTVRHRIVTVARHQSMVLSELRSA